MTADYIPIETHISLEKMVKGVIKTFRLSYINLIVYPVVSKTDNVGQEEWWIEDYVTISNHDRIIFSLEKRYLSLNSEGSIVASIDESLLVNQDLRENGRREYENIGLVSSVFKNRKEWHIPQIDFRCSPNKGNESLVVKFLTDVLGEHLGVLLNSGASYHYYGLGCLYSVNQWEMFMALLQESELVGEVWPILQRGSGFSVLRLSTSKDKPILPQIIGAIGNPFNL